MLYGLTYPQLLNYLQEQGLASPHTRALWQHLYRPTPPPLPPPLLRLLQSSPEFLSPPVTLADCVRSADGLTRKLLVRLHDGHLVETVVMGYPGRFTACLSSQVGCAMGCVFCATGQQGFTRHLGVAEIVGQVLLARELVAEENEDILRNLVFMGMGEPLHNHDAVMAALEILTDDRGIAISPRKVTLSTVGVVPGIRRLADEGVKYHLAVSLHGATEAERAALVPISSRWPLAELIEACRYYSRKTGNKIFFEWTLIAGKNDSVESAQELSQLLRELPAHVNLIPLNNTAGFAGEASQHAQIAQFQRTLKQGGIPSTVRQRRGIDVAAGCGQLAGRTTRNST
jgi:23S rRNA (adenine2503-C2)-methyltransferase